MPLLRSLSSPRARTVPALARLRSPRAWSAVALVLLGTTALVSAACANHAVPPIAPAPVVSASAGRASAGALAQADGADNPALPEAETIDTEPPMTLDEVVADATPALTALGVTSRYSWTDTRLAAAEKLGLTEARALRWFGPLLDAGATGPTLPRTDGHAETQLLDLVQGYLEHVGTKRAYLPLYRAAAHSVHASMALENVLERVVQAEIDASPVCPPPTVGEVSEARAALDDFMIIEPDASAHFALVARTPSSTERDDLAYLFAALSQDRGPVGEAVPVAALASPLRARPNPSPSVDPTFSPARLGEVRQRLDAAKKAGDLVAVQKAARSYLTMLGYPGAIRSEDEDHQTWGGPGFANVMRDLALADELLGDLDEAADLYQRANPGGGACGTSVGYRQQEQMQGLIRTAERRHQCRAVVAERLYAMDDSSFDYGPKRLSAAGWDVPRLYRAAVLTLERTAPKDALQASFASLPRDLAIKASQRLDKRGNEAVGDRVRALRGYADTLFAAEPTGGDTLPRMLAFTQYGSETVRADALAALADLAELTSYDPCDTGGMRTLHMHGTSREERKITARNQTCATKLPATVQRSIAAAFVAAAHDKSQLVREQVASGIAQVDVSPRADAVLATLTNDRSIKPGWSHGAAPGKPSTPVRPVTEAAVEAQRRLRTFRVDAARTRREQEAYRREQAAEAKRAGVSAAKRP